MPNSSAPITVNRQLNDVVAVAIERLRPRAKSLIITVFGDAIQPHGGNTWLGSLIRLVRPLGLNERIVRTAVFRLSKEEWLTSSQFGRRSYYRLTETGRLRVEAAYRRIYSHTARSWDGKWTLVFTNLVDCDGAHRDGLRRDLGWLGFGQLAPGVLLHPDPDQDALRQALIEAKATERAAVICGAAEAWVPPEALRLVIRSSWDIDQIAAGYTEFLDTFRPLWRAMEGLSDPDPELCFVLRTLLIHGYRRALLRDPLLPDELLPADWPGAAARQLCRNFYRLVQGPTETHLMGILVTPEGPVPEAGPGFHARFNGA